MRIVEMEHREPDIRKYKSKGKEMFEKSKAFKNLLALTLAVSCMLGMTACSNKGEKPQTPGNDAGLPESDAVYEARFQQMEGSGISSVTVSGDTMYFTAGERKEETGEYRQTIWKLKNGETVPEELPIAIEPDVYVNSMQPDEKGSLLMLLCKTEKSGSADTNSYYLSRCTTDGAELMSYDITSLGKNEESFSIWYMAQDGQENICLCGGENNLIWILDKEGRQKGKLTNDNWISAMFTLPNGKVAIACLDNTGKTYFCEIDTEGRKFGKTYNNLPDACNHFAAGRENTILIAGNNKVYEYDILTETYTELINLLDCDIDSNYISDISMLEDGSFLVVLAEWNAGEQKTELVYLTKKEASEAGQKETKETIILGTAQLTEDVKQQVLAFNQSSDRYHVEIREYGDGDIETGRMLLNAEIAAGGGPDLLDLTYISEDIDLYISKGVLEDLNPYLDGDADIRREDYVEKALNAYQKEGQLYCIVPGFMVYTAVGKTSDVGSEPGWTVDDVMALMDARPEGTELFRYCTKSQALRYCCIMSMDCFVDRENGECKFNDGYFEKVLEFVNRFPEEAARTEGEEGLHTKIQNGTVLLQEISIGRVMDYQVQYQLFGGEITPIGFPVKEGTGSFIMPNRELGINTRSKVKEGAWEFLRTFLMEDYQKNGMHMVFPVLHSVLDEQFEEAVTPEYGEENGVQTEMPKTSVIYGDWETEIYAATKEQVEEIKALIELADGVYSYPQEIAAIIDEEAAPFFDGKKSAKEAADIIQSRVQIYVNENL